MYYLSYFCPFGRQKVEKAPSWLHLWLAFSTNAQNSKIREVVTAPYYIIYCFCYRQNYLVICIHWQELWLLCIWIDVRNKCIQADYHHHTSLAIRAEFTTTNSAPWAGGNLLHYSSSLPPYNPRIPISMYWLDWKRYLRGFQWWPGNGSKTFPLGP